VVLSVRALIGMALVSCLALSACEGKKALPPPPPPVVLTPASHGCPLQGMDQGNAVPADQIVEVMGGHVPQWLPPGFGFEGAWTDGKSIWAVWTDGTCREVSVISADRGHPWHYSGPRLGPWVMAVDAPGCDNQVLGSANCLDYAAHVGPTGSVGFHASGLDRTEGDRIVLSIPL
jgi:hypothetical protein